jgi:drug/metabolite transporter (DMT)-like permease
MYMLGRTLAQFLGEPLVIVGLAFVILGVALVVLSTRITRAVRHSNEIKSDDKVNMALKLAGLLCILVGLILISIYVVIYIQTR